MSEQNPSIELARLGERMDHLAAAVDRLVKMVEGLEAKFVSKPAHDLTVERLEGRISVLEEERKERKQDGGFFGALRKAREVALTVTAVLAAVAILIAIDRGVWLR